MAEFNKVSVGFAELRNGQTNGQAPTEVEVSLWKDVSSGVFRGPIPKNISNSVLVNSGKVALDFSYDSKKSKPGIESKKNWHRAYFSKTSFTNLILASASFLSNENLLQLIVNCAEILRVREKESEAKALRASNRVGTSPSDKT